MTLAVTFWSKHKLASISFALSIIEIVIVWGVAAAVQLFGPQAALLRLAAGAWLFGGLASTVCGLAATIFDPDRKIGRLSLIVAVAVFFVCFLPPYLRSRSEPPESGAVIIGVSSGGVAAALIPGNGFGGGLGSSSVLGGTNSLVSVDALQEFRMETSTYAPEFGIT